MSVAAISLAAHLADATCGTGNHGNMILQPPCAPYAHCAPRCGYRDRADGENRSPILDASG
ncbi:hypothetical protein K0U73_02660 [bacterium]|nr:hypothetical protein [bacterium]